MLDTRPSSRSFTAPFPTIRNMPDGLCLAPTDFVCCRHPRSRLEQSYQLTMSVCAGCRRATAILRFHKVAKVGAKLGDGDALLQQSCQCRMHHTQRRDLLRGEVACVAEIPRLRGYGKLHRLLSSVRSQSRSSTDFTLSAQDPPFEPHRSCARMQAAPIRPKGDIPGCGQGGTALPGPAGPMPLGRGADAAAAAG